MINIKEKNGEIILNESDSYSEDSILQKYRNDELSKKFILAQIEKAPSQIQNLEAERDMIEYQLEHIKKRMKQFENIFQKRGINPSEELDKIRKSHTDEELSKKAGTISERQSFELKDKGGHIERITKNHYTTEEIVILYASNMYNETQAIEQKARIEKEIEKVQTRKEVQEKELEKVNDSLHSIRQFFKQKRIDIDKLLDKQAGERKQGQRDTGEIALK